MGNEIQKKDVWPPDIAKAINVFDHHVISSATEPKKH